MNFLMNAVQVVTELRQLAWTVRPDNERVVHVAEPADGLVVRPFQSRFFKVLHEEAGDHRRY
jgi:hypothetical protein